jgi:hypothetical protein
LTTSGMTDDQAQEIKNTVADQGGQVGQTAKEQVQEVASEATDRARDLAGEARSQVRDQTDVQRERLAGTLHKLGDELGEMAGNTQSSGIATEVARQAADRVRGLGDYVEQHEPSDLLNDVRAFARRRPGTFLLGAVAAGVLAGRLTRGVKAATGGSGSEPYGATGGSPGRPGQGSSGFPAPAYGSAPAYDPAPVYDPTPPPVTPSVTNGGTAAGTGPLDEEFDVVVVEVEPEGQPRHARGDLP